MPRAALCLLPPVPPLEVERGQLCFDWLEIVVVVHAVPERQRPHLTLTPPAPAPSRTRRPIRTYGLSKRYDDKGGSRAHAALSAGERAQMAFDIADLTADGVYAHRPKTWADCRYEEGPCGFVSCRHNLYLTTNPETGAIFLTFPGKEIDELEETCALRIAERGGMSQEQVGKLMNTGWMRVSHVEAQGLVKIRRQHPELASRASRKI